MRSSIRESRRGAGRSFRRRLKATSSPCSATASSPFTRRPGPHIPALPWLCALEGATLTDCAPPLFPPSSSFDRIKIAGQREERDGHRPLRAPRSRPADTAFDALPLDIDASSREYDWRRRYSDGLGDRRDMLDPKWRAPAFWLRFFSMPKTTGVRAADISARCRCSRSASTAFCAL